MGPEQPDRIESPLELEGTVNGVPVNVGINRSDVTPDTFVYVGKGLQQRLGVSAGDLIESLPPD